MLTETEFAKFPPFGVIVGVATVNAADTTSVNIVVLVTLPPLELTVMGKLPVVVEAAVVIFSTVEQAGLQDESENEGVAPVGNPETLKETVWLLPESNVVETVLVTEAPAATD